MNLKTYPALCLVTTLRKNLPRAQRKMTRITMYAYIFYILFILITSYNIYFNFLTNTRCACAHALTLKHIKSYSSLYIIEIKILIFQTQMILFCYHEALCTCFEQHDSKKVQYCVERELRGSVRHAQIYGTSLRKLVMDRATHACSCVTMRVVRYPCVVLMLN